MKKRDKQDDEETLDGADVTDSAPEPDDEEFRARKATTRHGRLRQDRSVGQRAVSQLRRDECRTTNESLERR